MNNTFLRATKNNNIVHITKTKEINHNYLNRRARMNEDVEEKKTNNNWLLCSVYALESTISSRKSSQRGRNSLSRTGVFVWDQNGSVKPIYDHSMVEKSKLICSGWVSGSLGSPEVYFVYFILLLNYVGRRCRGVECSIGQIKLLGSITLNYDRLLKLNFESAIECEV